MIRSLPLSKTTWILALCVAPCTTFAQQGDVTEASARIVVSAPSERAPIILNDQPTVQLLDGKPQLRGAAPSAELVRWDDFDASTLLAEDAQLDSAPGIPQRVGVVRPVPDQVITPALHGAWSTLEDNSELWVMRLEAPGALEMRVHLSALHLAPGTRLVIAGEGPDEAVAYYGDGPLGKGEIWAGSAMGSVVYLEYHDPTGVAADPIIEINEILHVYREPPLAIAQDDSGQRGLATCQEDVNCHTVDQTAKDSVGRMFFISGGFGGVCTGGLLNDNDPNTFAGYFLTANHCLSSQAAVDTLQIRWFYETNSCNGSLSWLTSPVGGTLLATSPNSDFTFIRLVDDPDNGQGLAAWTTSDPNPNGAVVHGIHHPAGSFKRYSNGLTTTQAPICGGLPLSNFIYNDWSLGFTEGGSSGSPAFNNNWEVIGQLFGACLFADPACNNPALYNVVYGRFSSTHSSIATFLNSITPDDAFEDNDTLATAAPLPVGTHGLRLVDFDDYFEIDAGCQPNTITASTTHSNSDMDLDLRLLNDSGAVLDQSLGNGANKTVSANVGPGKYIVRATKSSDWGGDYTLAIALAVFDDCNSNGLQDNCDIIGGTSNDLNTNGLPDDCEDCNLNQVPDEQDIAGATSTDCNLNEFPDDCELDCNNSGAPDDCDVIFGTSPDCDGNLVPDECDPDCNMNGAPDACDIAGATSTDLNGNALPDDCEDCNSNAIPDELDLSTGTSLDCNTNGVLDECDIADAVSDDCNANDIPDECEPDCNNNGVTDSCDIAGGTSTDCLGGGIPDECGDDCNTNGIPDPCDLEFGPSTDCNSNSTPDECEPVQQGYALGFDGIDDHVSVGTGLNLSGGFTIEAWVRTADTSIKQVIFSKRQLTPLAGYLLQQEDGKLVFTSLGVLRHETAAAVLTAEEWTHVAVSIDVDLTVRFHVNGVLTDTVPGGGPIISSLGEVFIGSLAPDVRDVWLGEIDEVRFWSTVRTETDIAADMSRQISATAPGLVSYWRLNDAAGTIAKDQTGSEDGSLVNGPQWVDLFSDCNTNGSIDLCDISTGVSLDINTDGFPDECGTDCNNNGLPDEDELAAGTSPDCNSNAVPDECDVAQGTSNDCSGDEVPDECDPDCNSNGVADTCDVVAGTATDCDNNGVLDGCEMGQSGSGIEFDGVDDYVNVGRLFDTFANGFTIEAWVRVDNTSTRQRFISKRKTIPATSGFALFQDGGILKFSALGVQSYVTSNVVILPGVWTHVAVVYDSSSDAHFYINGAFEQTVAGSGAVVTDNGRVYVGRLAPDGADYLDGAMDELRVWSIERPASAIAATMSSRLTGAEDGLAGYWRFDESAGAVTADTSPAATVATLEGASWGSGFPLDTDCNSNGVFDACDTLTTESDCNANAILDSCESPTFGDFTGDSLISLADMDGLTACLAGPDDAPSAPCTAMCLSVFDADTDGNIDLRDFATLQPLMVDP